MTDHERIWLEPSPGADEDYGRQWCQHNVWGDDATEYLRADLAEDEISKNQQLVTSSEQERIRSCSELMERALSAESLSERMSSDWFEFCEAMGVICDTQEAVAYKLTAKISNAQFELREAIKPAYLGLLVLKTMCRKAGLTGGVEATDSAMAALVAAMPELPSLSALRGAALNGGSDAP